MNDALPFDLGNLPVGRPVSTDPIFLSGLQVPGFPGVKVAQQSQGAAVARALTVQKFIAENKPLLLAGAFALAVGGVFVFGKGRWW
ncbi:MAG: hypothetical protein A4C66_10780 [Nitrospira sp. HN-bin3]|uniref:hypothetical protein n=1 Tax=Nitrospira cf. moscoviensis SBR1015 TaxID=96242 RepID=UPI000A0DAE79|nr:hypothetical protein [Nitrospira cf. moscoviensis SBR1015]OQW40311.1 MAG: hypothetical protein A4C66_10780 [Nitrospira sp. HN-bin3]